MASDGTAPLRWLLEVLHRALTIETLPVGCHAGIDQLIAEINESVPRYAVVDTPLQWREYAAHLGSLSRRAKNLIAKYRIPDAG